MEIDNYQILPMSLSDDYLIPITPRVLKKWDDFRDFGNIPDPRSFGRFPKSEFSKTFPNYLTTKS